jgi:hypothetical protein
MSIKISIIASSVRPQLYEAFFKSLEGTSVEYEVVFVGNNIEFITEIILTGTYDLNPWKSTRYPKLNYIKTNNIKPAQCYEIARRHATGETIVWAADDCEFPNDVIGKAYKYWKEKNNKKLILSIQTREYYLTKPEDHKQGLTNMDWHVLHGKGTPLMAPLAMISREYLQELGGFDRRYTCGQYENDVVMNAYADGAKVEVFGGKDCFIDIDHLGKFEKVSGKKGFKEHNKRPFASGYPHDRKILEGSWIRNGIVQKDRLDAFEPYKDTDLLTKSQSHKGIWQ